MTKLEHLAEYYPLKSSDYVKSLIGRAEHWFEALRKPEVEFSRFQVAKDLMDLAVAVMYDDGKRLGQVELARALLHEEKAELWRKARAKNKKARQR